MKNSKYIPNLLLIVLLSLGLLGSSQVSTAQDNQDLTKLEKKQKKKFQKEKDQLVKQLKKETDEAESDLKALGKRIDEAGEDVSEELKQNYILMEQQMKENKEDLLNQLETLEYMTEGSWEKFKADTKNWWVDMRENINQSMNQMEQGLATDNN